MTVWDCVCMNVCVWHLLIPLITLYRLHYAVEGYHEMIQYIHEMSVSKDESLRENSKVMLSNLVYHPEYRDVFVSLLRNYNEVVQVSA